MIAELGRRPLMRPDGPWRWRLSVGAKISYPVTAAVVTSLPETEGHTGCDAVRGPRPRTTASIRAAGDSVATTHSRD